MGIHSTPSSLLRGTKVEARLTPLTRPLPLLQDESHTETWGLDKYHGGRANSVANWPGLQQPPLEILADRFCVHFHSDGSNNDFGFVLRAVGHVARFDEPPPDSASLLADPPASLGDSSASGAHPSFSGGLNQHPW